MTVELEEYRRTAMYPNPCRHCGGDNTQEWDEKRRKCLDCDETYLRDEVLTLTVVVRV